MPFSIAGPSGPALPSLDGINRASDSISSGQQVNYKSNSAEAAISGRLDAAVGVSTVSIRNATNQVSALQKADQNLGQATDIVEQIQANKVQQGNGALAAEDKAILEKEVQTLEGELTNLLENSEFNGNDLYATAGIDIEKLKTKLDDIRSSSDVTSADSLDELANLQSEISSVRAEIGGRENAIASEVSTLESELRSNQERRSDLSDTDFASEFANLIKEELLFNANVKVFDHRLDTEASLINLLTE